MKRSSLLIFSILFFTQSVFADGLVEDQTVQMQTQWVWLHHLEAEGNITQGGEVRDMPMSQMGLWLKRMRDLAVLPPFDQQPPLIFIYLEKKTMLDKKDQWAAQAISQFQSTYPGVIPEVRFEIEEITAKTVRYVQDAVVAGRCIFLYTWTLHQVEPTLGFAAIPTNAGLALVAGNTVVESFSLLFADHLHRWYVNHGFSLINSRFKKFDFFNKHFQTPDDIKDLNATLWNLFLQGTLRPLAAQTLAHLTNPEKFSITALGFTFTLLGNAWGAYMYSRFMTGMTTLQRKGWVTGSQRKLIFQSRGILDVAVFVLTINDDYWWRLIPWGLQWGFDYFVSYLGRTAPSRVDRIVLIPSSFKGKDFDDIKDEQSAENMAWLNTEEDLANAARAAKKRGRAFIVSGSRCSSALSRLREAWKLRNKNGLQVQ